MSKRLISFVAVLFTLSILLSACNVESASASCSNVTITYYADVDGTYTFTAHAGSSTSGRVIGSASQNDQDAPSTHTASFSLNPAQQPGSMITVQESGPSSYDIGSGSITLACSAQGVTWFNPGDGRVDGQPADRIVGYCNLTSGVLTVYGVKNDSNGIFLANFNYLDLLKAGPKGIYVDTKGNGVVSVSVDDQGDFWMAWNGGPYGADGTPKNGFAKGIHCAFTG